MTEGRILVAENDGIYLLKLNGDVRVTLCASISDYLSKIFSGSRPTEVYVDLLDAECIDSTTLGLLARLAIHTQQEFDFRTRLLCNNRNILRIFEAMDIDGLFDIVDAEPPLSLEPREVVPGDLDEEEIRRQVLDAHKLLVKLNPDLMSEFYDLITSLESQD